MQFYAWLVSGSDSLVAHTPRCLVTPQHFSGDQQHQTLPTESRTYKTLARIRPLIFETVLVETSAFSHSISKILNLTTNIGQAHQLCNVLFLWFRRTHEKLILPTWKYHHHLTKKERERGQAVCRITLQVNAQS